MTKTAETTEQRATRPGTPDAGTPSLAVLLLLVAAAGAAGALLRLGAAAVFPEYGMKFPWTTFAVNLAGSVLLGLLVGVSQATRLPGWTVPVLGTGLLGSFTTFSAIMVATVDGMTSQQTGGFGAIRMAFAPSPEVEWLAYLGISVLLCTAGAAAGIVVGRALFGCTGMDCDHVTGGERR